MRGRRSVGVILLAVWLILTGISPFLNVAIPSRNMVLSVIALVAGVLLLMDR